MLDDPSELRHSFPRTKIVGKVLALPGTLTYSLLKRLYGHGLRNSGATTNNKRATPDCQTISTSHAGGDACPICSGAFPRAAPCVLPSEKGPLP